MKRKFCLGEFVLRWRAPIGMVLLLISALMAYYVTQVQIRTRFVDFFPARHAYVLLNRKFEKFGSANTLIFVLEPREGDIFNHRLLQKIHDLTEAVDRLPGVNHNEVMSLASERVSYSDAVPGALISRPYMHPGVPETPEDTRQLKLNVTAHQNRLRYLVSRDGRAAAVTAAFNENEFDSRVLFDEIQRLAARYQDQTTRVYVAGEPVVRGYGYYYMPAFSLTSRLASR